MEEEKSTKKILSNNSSKKTKKGEGSSTKKTKSSGKTIVKDSKKDTVKKASVKADKTEKKVTAKKTSSNKDIKKSTTKSSTTKTGTTKKAGTTKKTSANKKTSTVKKTDQIINVSKNLVETEKEKKRRSNTSSANSVVIDLAAEGLDKTGSIAKINEGEYISEVVKNNEDTSKDVESKDVSDDKKKDNHGTDDFDGKFRLDILDVLIIVVITAIISCVFTGLMLNYQYRKSNNYIDSSITKNEGVRKFLSLYSEILNDYYEEVDPNGMIEAAISGMVSFLGDNYSIYVGDNNGGELTDPLDNSYNGLGIVIQGPTIVSIYKNSPAEKVGLRADDVIVRINGNEINNETYVNIDSYLNKDSDNEVVILRDGQEFTYKVGMDKINVPTAASTLIQSGGKKLGYIKITSFTYLTFEDFQDCLMELEKESIDSLIVDLRSNTGGYLKAAYDISSLFVEKDKVIYSLEQKGKIETFKDETKEKREYKVVVLINNGSASASEIMAAALHDSYGATLIGKTSYGKGTVQRIKQYNDDSAVKYTIAKWLRPNGDCIDGIGITPDYEVDIEYDANQIYDRQLDKAIELLSN